MSALVHVTFPKPMCCHFDWFSAFLALVCTTRQKRHTYRRICQKSYQEYAKNPPRSSKNLPRTIHVNDESQPQMPPKRPKATFLMISGSSQSVETCKHLPGVCQKLPRISQASPKETTVIHRLAPITDPSIPGPKRRGGLLNLLNSNKYQAECSV